MNILIKYLMEAIYAIDSKNGLAKNGTIPWHSKKDLTFFRNKTKNNVVVMGKKTFLSLPNGFLKDRLNIVLSTNPYTIKNDNNQVLKTNDISICFSLLQNKDTWRKTFPYLADDFIIFLIGGKQIYEEFIPLCNKIWVTEIKKDYDCDLTLDFDYSKQFSKEIVEEDEELRIIKYQK